MGSIEGLEVVQSRIHGYGIIATRRFCAGEVICHGDGILYRESQEFDDTYSLVLPGYELNPDGSEGPPLFWDLVDQTRWLNHSCDPSSEVDSSWDAARGRAVAWWVALRDIEIGEEITYDYGFVGPLAEICSCGAGTCRGLIVDTDPDEIAAVPAELQMYLRRENLLAR
jgi:hypothetical protein